MAPFSGIISFCILTAVSAARLSNTSIPQIVNSMNTTWQAGNNFLPIELKHLTGTILEKNSKVTPMSDCAAFDGDKLPENFDARAKWPECETISEIYDQSNCGSCWAVSTTTTFADRICVASEGRKNPTISPQNLMTCCTTCSIGICEGGYIEEAWEYITEYGLVTGGRYNSSQGCQPYTLEPCEHHTKERSELPRCSELKEKDPECKKMCYNVNYTRSYDDDLYTTSEYGIVEPCNAMKEIYENGPIVAVFSVYDDFTYYKKGVYQHVTGGELGGHAIRIIGWGVEKGIPYWLAANSWNTHWGDNGTFKIRRGVDECLIESYMMAGTPSDSSPDYSDSP